MASQNCFKYSEIAFSDYSGSVGSLELLKQFVRDSDPLVRTVSVKMKDIYGKSRVARK